MYEQFPFNVQIGILGGKTLDNHPPLSNYKENLCIVL